MENKTIKEKYIEAVGRRKTSTARVRIWKSVKHIFIINERDAKEYFKTEEERRLIADPIIKGLTGEEKIDHKWKVEVKVSGGGAHSQAEAVRHGLARALVLSDIELRGKMKTLGYLKRDPRAKERRKFGLKKARKAPQWSKR
ncbi:MAG: 30S ribosomal protein S9 [Candidatus Nomurabacteria bacterium GW2011_GWE1_32_28]|uniref:30S ribosomal protein S9 n=1 Tax=Candidatus Nomurabacteria bacterium GW2011_GWF1_31_48 TaxID=1618767 RepID=A0A0F9YH02_9BACT|nr:MAG: 30S ribosomal protein S9 [Candidatus Nomurabacteria bacterium GW2011_GWF2_30_133]KKP28930.1 MAG: 30S ribosomal protein S9 [Candidatus Nomurabacteria bacterium GW2011_GWE2_31_40]KKP30668.1 MAG: 30S ribosomal protein S9 [Candidatus Nomurabacteria bacterium GW2011_GWF1_31_48]KKP35186.1 MAG: 30S ribosomal protein S9 [Candidatus Nomurabacteria bacterium GW2011_GWE1_32_28]HAS80496.1 30S ribosomal protein S9 [Candidatus Nomurabacteria bacterium]